MFSQGFGRITTLLLGVVVFGIVALWAGAAIFSTDIGKSKPTPRPTPPESVKDSVAYSQPIEEYLEATTGSSDGSQTFCSATELGASDTSDIEVDVYAWVACKSYLSETTFIRQTSALLKPAVISLTKNPDESFRVVSHEFPTDDEYVKDVERLFPESVHARILGPGALVGMPDIALIDAMDAFGVPLRYLPGTQVASAPAYVEAIADSVEDLKFTLRRGKSAGLECLFFDVISEMIVASEVASSSHEICTPRPEGARTAAIAWLPESRLSWAFGFAPVNADRLTAHYQDGRATTEFIVRDGVFAGLHDTSRLLVGVKAFADGKDVGGCAKSLVTQC